MCSRPSRARMSRNVAASSEEVHGIRRSAGQRYSSMIYHHDLARPETQIQVIPVTQDLLFWSSVPRICTQRQLEVQKEKYCPLSLVSGLWSLVVGLIMANERSVPRLSAKPRRQTLNNASQLLSTLPPYFAITNAILGKSTRQRHVVGLTGGTFQC